VSSRGLLTSLKPDPFFLCDAWSKACPSGCLNGGGQLPSVNLSTVKQALDSGRYRPPLENPSLVNFYKEFVRNEPYSTDARSILHTHFHAVAKLDNDQAIVAAGW